MAATTLCQHTWLSDRTTVLEDTFRQHRCGQPAGHGADCACRYCGRRRDAGAP